MADHCNATQLLEAPSPATAAEMPAEFDEPVRSAAEAAAEPRRGRLCLDLRLARIDSRGVSGSASLGPARPDSARLGYRQATRGGFQTLPTGGTTALVLPPPLAAACLLARPAVTQQAPSLSAQAFSLCLCVNGQAFASCDCPKTTHGLFLKASEFKTGREGRSDRSQATFISYANKHTCAPGWGEGGG